MLEIVCYDSDGRVIDHLTQWDVGQSVSVRGATYSGDPVFHFCNRRSYEALVVTAKNVDGALVADIPNVLLTESLPIEIYMYYQQKPGSAKTVYTISIPVEQRKKPTDYIFEDNVDYVGLVEINKQMSAALAEVRKAVDEVKTAVGLVDGAIGSAQSATNDANAAAALANTAAGKADTASGEAKTAAQSATAEAKKATDAAAEAKAAAQAATNSAGAVESAVNDAKAATKSANDISAELNRKLAAGEFNGKTPVKGKDYFTPTEEQQFEDTVYGRAVERINPVLDAAGMAANEAKAATQAATTAATEATTSKNAADESTRNANLAAENANEAATKANEAAQNATIGLEEVKKDVGNKLDKPTAQPTVGQILKVRSTNPDGSFVVEWADDGGGTVQDVQINGATIVQDGVANIPIASRSYHGVIRPWRNISLSGSYPGSIYIPEATKQNMTEREYYAVVQTHQWDEMLKYAMCDGKGPAWTAVEQAAARARMGIDNWEPILETELSEQALSVEVKLFPDGSPLSLSKFCVFVTNIPENTPTNTAKIRFDAGTKNVANLFLRYAEVPLGNSQYAATFYQQFGDNAYLVVSGKGDKASVRYNMDAGVSRYDYGGLDATATTINRLSVRTSDSGKFQLPVGTKITIYGVRA